MQSEIEDVYRVFARYPRPERVRGCQHCVTEDDQRDLLGAPLRELDAELLRRFSHKALNTWGDVDDLRHFLPRLLELSLRGDGDLHGLFAKLGQAGWTAWPEDERDAIRTCLDLWWEHAPSGDESVWGPADTPLGTLAEAGDDLDPYLDSWWGRDTPQALWALSDLVSEVAHTTPPARDDRVVTWLATTRGWMESAFFDASESGRTELAEALSQARQLLDLVTLEEPVSSGPGPGPGACATSAPEVGGQGSGDQGTGRQESSGLDTDDPETTGPPEPR